MNALYVKARATSLRLIKKNGTSLYVYRFANTSNPVTGTVTTVATRGSLWTVVLPASKGTVEAFDNRFTDEMIAGKLRFAIAAAKGATIAPHGGEIMYYSGEYWSIMGDTPLDPDQSEPIIFKFGMVKTALSTAQIAAIAAI